MNFYLKTRPPEVTCQTVLMCGTKQQIFVYIILIPYEITNGSVLVSRDSQVYDLSLSDRGQYHGIDIIADRLVLSQWLANKHTAGQACH